MGIPFYLLLLSSTILASTYVKTDRDRFREMKDNEMVNKLVKDLRDVARNPEGLFLHPVTLYYAKSRLNQYQDHLQSRGGQNPYFVAKVKEAATHLSYLEMATTPLTDEVDEAQLVDFYEELVQQAKDTFDKVKSITEEEMEQELTALDAVNSILFSFCRKTNFATFKSELLWNQYLKHYFKIKKLFEGKSRRLAAIPITVPSSWNFTNGQELSAGQYENFRGQRSALELKIMDAISTYVIAVEGGQCEVYLSHPQVFLHSYSC